MLKAGAWHIGPGWAAKHPGHDADVGFHAVEANLVDLLAVDRESAAKGDADAVDLAEVAVGGDFFVAVDIIYNDLAAFGVILHIQHGANYLAIRQGDF